MNLQGRFTTRRYPPVWKRRTRYWAFVFAVGVGIGLLARWMTSSSKSLNVDPIVATTREEERNTNYYHHPLTGMEKACHAAVDHLLACKLLLSFSRKSEGRAKEMWSRIIGVFPMP